MDCRDKKVVVVEVSISTIDHDDADVHPEEQVA